MKTTEFTISTKYICITLMYFTVILISCEDFLEVEPPATQIVTESVYTDDATATSAISGLYSEMMNTSNFASGGQTSVTILTGLSSDELTNHVTSSNNVQFYTNSLLPENTTIKTSLWDAAYKYIYYSNLILDGISNSPGITQLTREHLEGEAKFIRAFCHFYLLNLFGDVPLVVTPDYRINMKVSRSPQSLVYEQIISDLTEAERLLPRDYSHSKNERVRPNAYTAKALLSRVYLYNKEWQNAEIKATEVIETPLYKLSDNLNDVFLKNSEEAIWQLKPVNPTKNTNEGAVFILFGPPGIVSLTNSALDAFEANDNRKNSWIQNIDVDGTVFHYPFKYKFGSQTVTEATEYSMVFRLAEQYLIRSEARANLNNIEGAKSDLDLIRSRAGLENTSASDQSSILSAIQKERQTELFSEWGHRWFDLKRTNRVDQILAQVKGSSWESSDALYPVPQQERINNQNLTQNQGY